MKKLLKHPEQLLLVVVTLFNLGFEVIVFGDLDFMTGTGTGTGFSVLVSL